MDMFYGWVRVRNIVRHDYDIIESIKLYIFTKVLNLILNKLTNIVTKTMSMIYVFTSSGENYRFLTLILPCKVVGFVIK